jgi:hypothetical protein
MLPGFVRTIQFAVVFAGLLQGSLVFAQQWIAPARPATALGQEAQISAEGILATILQSGSTNTRAFQLFIRNDGSATVQFGDAKSDPPQAQRLPSGTVDATTLRRLLTEIGDVSRIPTGDCAKSASFGTRTQISYAGKTSGDLQCILHEALGGDQMLLDSSEDLGRFVQSTLSQLKIDNRRVILSQ